VARIWETALRKEVECGRNAAGQLETFLALAQQPSVPKSSYRCISQCADLVRVANLTTVGMKASTIVEPSQHPDGRALSHDECLSQRASGPATELL